MKTQKTATKQVTVLAVYKFNKVARICFETLSSNGNDHYHTCFQGNGRESCSCPSKGGCYHRDGLRERAQAYFESQKQVSTPASRLAREGKPFASYRDEQGYHSVSCVGHEIADVVVVPMSSEVMAEIATREEVMAERKLATFEQAMDEQYASDPRRGLSQGEVEAARSNMVHLYDEY